MPVSPWMALLLTLVTFTPIAKCYTPCEENYHPGDPILGIDLGMTYSRIGFLDQDGSFTAIADELGNQNIPAYVAWVDGELVAGNAAKSQRKCLGLHC
jgi:hypothetical protein